MSRRAAVALALACLLAAIAGCGGSSGAAEPPPPEATGMITEVRESEGRVSDFTLEALSGTYEVHIADEVEYGFDLRHLYDHERRREPVRCDLELRDDGRVYALRIDDA